MTHRTATLLLLLVLGSRSALADEAGPANTLAPPLPAEAGSGGASLAPANSSLLSKTPEPTSEPTWPAPQMRATTPREREVESAWYTRVDWFHWNERSEGIDFVTESGVLTTVGYQRTVGIERFRAELFGGDVSYDGFGQFDNGDLEPLASTTHYLGARGEIELLLRPEMWDDRVNFIVGLGSRFWVRDLTGGIGDWGDPIWGYQETWWTIYPYLGLESERPLNGSLRLYSQARLGATAFTYSHAAISDEPTWPRCGLTGSVEIGLRGEHFFLSGECEVMTWSESPVAAGYFQPDSEMVTVGGRFGFRF